MPGPNPLHLKCLAVALTAAVEAGQYFRSRIHSIADVKTKSSPSDLVTDVDPACEKMIRDAIARHFPQHTVFGEETTAPGAAASARAAAEVASEEHLWIVDPLDGTTNFVHGMPLSVVSIAYSEHGTVQVGVIYDPYRDEVFFAVHGQGTRLGNAEMVKAWAATPSDVIPGDQVQCSGLTEVRRSVVATGIPTRSASYERTTANTVTLLRHIKSIRALGAAALHLAYVASGRIDVFWEYDLNAWDLAAGVLLVTEAGGIVKALGGDSYDLHVRDILAGATEVLTEHVENVLVAGNETTGAIPE